MLRILEAARKAGLHVFYAMHRRYRPGDYEAWKYIAPIQKRGWASKVFEFGTWGGEIRSEFQPKPGELVAAEHWCSSGFANTDLDLQLKKHGIHRLIVVFKSQRPHLKKMWLRPSASLRNRVGRASWLRTAMAEPLLPKPVMIRWLLDWFTLLLTCRIPARKSQRTESASERPRQIGRHKENARRVHIYRSGAVS